MIGHGVKIGNGCRIGALSSIGYALIGERVYIHPGARIGQDGFGFAMGPQGHLTVPQLGRVVIHDDVEIGANSTIDRGAGPDTVIGIGCKIDKLVQIGHNVQLGRGCVMVAQSGISGSTKLGDFVHFRFRANAFLHHMVRNVMGCLVEIGSGRRPAAWMADVLASRSRDCAAPTFMPDGLYLAQVGYPAQFAVPAPVTGSVPWSSVWTDQTET